MTQLSDYYYDLPDELIAQVPLAHRSDSRLLVLEGSQRLHLDVRSLPTLLRRGDRLVFNNTRVIPARLFGHKLSGGKLELMLERVTDQGTVLAKIRCSKSPKPGSVIVLEGAADDAAFATSVQAKVIARHDDLFELSDNDDDAVSVTEFIQRHGDIPLPPYIQRKPDAGDAERYQTVFAQEPGAVAAPTAGLHFDNELLAVLEEHGISHSFITLHVGAGTFQPVRVDDVSKHIMHAERAEVTRQVVDEIHATKSAGGRVVAVGTTCVRTLEAAAAGTGELSPFNGETRLFITPGFKFNVIDAMITNFHLPESTLLMLVAAFAGLDNTLAAYTEAVQKRYRFFSYGDAMFVLPGTDAPRT
ncbi:MAG: tRNA preQ1(34) S-adenosylmethionine ribosyltransferase-isomerase QueA [Granulosicoccus sp.]